MKKYIFIIRIDDSYHTSVIHMDFKSDRDARSCARAALKDWKKEHDGVKINVYESRLFGDSWIKDRHVVTYE